MKVALITGASGGIGEVFARKLASRGHNLFLVARSADKLATICNQLRTAHGIKADYFAVDLVDSAASKQVFEESLQRGFTVDLLINNAGFGSVGEFALLDIDSELRMVELNVKALVELTHRFLGPMRERGSGSIINVASTVAFQPVPFMATYAATKAFVLSFSEALWEENRKNGIKVLALCPGSTATNFFNAAGTSTPPPSLVQTPEDVVETGLRALEQGKSHVISGWKNFLLAESNRLAPRTVATRIAAAILKKRYKPV